MRLELFDVSRRWPKQCTQSNDGTSFREQRNFFTVFRSIHRPSITFKLPHGDMDRPPRPHNFFQYLVIGMCHFRRLWNGMCDRNRAEITVMQFTGHSLPVHHCDGTVRFFTLSQIVSQAVFYNYFTIKIHTKFSRPISGGPWGMMVIIVGNRIGNWSSSCAQGCFTWCCWERHAWISSPSHHPQLKVNHIYQPFHSGRIWHMVNFLSGV